MRKVEILRKPDGTPVNVPEQVSEANLDQLVKRFTEVASYSPQDGSGLVSMFRGFHGGRWTELVLQRALEELRHPSIELNLSQPRSELAELFEVLLEEHRTHPDSEFGYPRQDRSKLPL